MVFRLLTSIALATFLAFIGLGYSSAQLVPEVFMLAVLSAAVAAIRGWFRLQPALGYQSKLVTNFQFKPLSVIVAPNHLRINIAWRALLENSPSVC